MPTLNIGGQRVNVGDDFLSLPPEQQNATVDEIARSLSIAPQKNEVDTFEQKAIEMADKIESVQGAGGAGGLFRNSFSLGLEDKISGLMEGGAEMLRGGEFGEGYKVGRRAQEILEERARNRSGKMGTAAEIAGTIATGTLAKAPAALGAMGRIGQTAKEAAILGTYQGVGDSQSDTVGGVAADALTSGGISALMGGTLQTGMEVARPLVKGGISAGRAARDYVRGTDQRAAQKVAGALADDGLTPGKAVGAMQRRQQPLISVGGENTIGLGRAASARPGAGRTTINRALDQQQASSAGRATQAVTEALGGGDIPFNRRVGQMIANRSKNASKAYEPAFKRNFGAKHSMKFDGIASRIPSDAVRNAQRIAQLEGRPFGEQLIASIDDATGAIKFSRAPSLREWHYIQRGLRASADNAYRSGVGEVGSAYSGLRKELISLMDEASPRYKQARKLYASESQMIDALNKGRDIMKPGVLRNIDDFADDFADMTKAEKEMVRIGLSRSLEDMIQSTPDAAGDVVRKLFGSPQKRSAIRAVFDSDSAFRKFQAEMMRMSKGARAFKDIRTGSRTSFVDAEKDAFGAVADAADVALGSGGANMVVRSLNKLLKNIGGMDDQTAASVAKILAQEDPRLVSQALSQASSRQGGREAIDRLLSLAADRARNLIAASSAGVGSSIAVNGPQ